MSARSALIDADFATSASREPAGAVATGSSGGQLRRRHPASNSSGSSAAARAARAGAPTPRADAGDRVGGVRPADARHLADDELLVLQNDDPLDHVLELADVAGPVVGLEQLPRASSESCRTGRL